ncbi:MAG: MerR family transcriptional regulator [Clostridium sp.]
MAQHFSIGEISKLCNIPIKTLRYYDEINLLKPSYKNPKTGYRYYSVEQFIHIDLIKFCRSIGMPLKDIITLSSNGSSVEYILETLQNQARELDKKIQSLQSIKDYIEKSTVNISNALESGLNTPFITTMTNIKFKQYKCRTTTLDEFEQCFRKVTMDLETKYQGLNPLLGSTTSYSDFIKKGTLTVNSMRCYNIDSSDSLSLENGRYASIIFDDGAENYHIYYRMLLDYINDNNIKVCGDFNEFWFLSRTDENLLEKSLIQVYIKVI